MSLDRERLLEILHYDAETGIWTWRASIGTRARPGKEAGSRRPGRYVTIRIDNKLYQAHHLAWLYVRGEWPKHEVDHRNGQRSDCRWTNMREANDKEQAQNRGVRSDNVSGIKGVNRRARSYGVRYTARIMVDGKSLHLGTFADAAKAAAAYRVAAEQHFGNFARK
jgi:hypothetical protein